IARRSRSRVLVRATDGNRMAVRTGEDALLALNDLGVTLHDFEPHTLVVADRDMLITLLDVALGTPAASPAARAPPSLAGGRNGPSFLVPAQRSASRAHAPSAGC